MRIVLDTSAYSQLRVGNNEVADRIAAADVVYVPVIALGELEGGFQRGRRAAENRAVLDAFLAEDFVEVLSVTPDVARLYGAVFASLREAGTPIPVNDIWIAAVTIDAGAHLVTFDDDFARIERLDHSVLVP